MLEKGLSEIEVRRDVHDRYNQQVDQKHAQMVWTHAGVDNWYQNKDGRIVSVSPWRLVDYWCMTRNTDLKDFKLA
jgi:4-hydroxyacetophenone monooxygenase